MVRRRQIALGTAVLILMLTAIPALALTRTWTYDGCRWQLKVEDQSSSYTSSTRDLNGGCHYLTNWSKDPAIPSYSVTGPTNVAAVYTWVAHTIGSDSTLLGKGRVTTWEHEWTQTSS